MPGDPAAGADPAGTEPAAADFDRLFSAASPGIRGVWELVEPELPPEIEPLSFVSLALLRQVARALDLSPGQALVDLGCGRGGPGLWLARAADAALTGVDFSAVAVAEATRRAALFGLAGRARFLVGDLTRTGLPRASADAAVSVDAFHFAADRASAAAEARRVLRPGRRLVLTNWQPKVPGDARLPRRARIDWPQLLHGAGFADVELAATPLASSTPAATPAPTVRPRSVARGAQSTYMRTWGATEYVCADSAERIRWVHGCLPRPDRRVTIHMDG